MLGVLTALSSDPIAPSIGIAYYQSELRTPLTCACRPFDTPENQSLKMQTEAARGPVLS